MNPQDEAGSKAEIPVGIIVIEEVTYYVPTTVTVPAGLADDPDALRDYLDQDEGEGAWLDDFHPIKHVTGVNDREVVSVEILPGPLREAR